MEKSSVFKTMENPPRLETATVVSPIGQGKKRMAGVADEEEESKKQKQNVVVSTVKYVMKNEILEKGVTPSNLSGMHPELFLERLQGNIELVWCDDGKREGFIDPFVKAFFHYDKMNPNAVKTFEDLKKKTGIFVGVSRRISREKNESQFKEGNHGGLFKLTYFVRHCGSNSSNLVLDHRVCLEAIADVS
jgi:hypothetical protein